MEFKEGLMILINLAILGTVIAAAVYVFQIGNKDRSVKCGAVDKFAGDNTLCNTDYGAADFPKVPCTDVTYSDSGWGGYTCNNAGSDINPTGCTCTNNPWGDGRKVPASGWLSDWVDDGTCQTNDKGEWDGTPCGAGYCHYPATQP